MAELDDEDFTTLRQEFLSNAVARLEAMGDTLGRLNAPAGVAKTPWAF